MASGTRPILFSEKPYAVVVSKDNFQRQNICSSCFKCPPRTFRCTKCRLLFYCGVDCQKEDWNSGQHRRECRVFAATPENEQATLRDNELLRLIARILARKDEDDGIAKESEVVTDRELKLRKLSDLCTNVEFVSDAKFQRYSIEFSRLYGCRSKFFAQIDQDTLRQVMGLIRSNAITIHDFDILEGMLTLGTGLYLQFSRFNHACDPDLSVFWEGALMHIRLLKPIDLAQMDLDSLTIRYRFESTLNLTQERRADLEKHFHFKCECSLCQNETLDRIKECSVVQKCPECKERMVVTLEDKALLECLHCGKKTPENGKDALEARSLVLRLRLEEPYNTKADLFAQKDQATQRLDPIRNIFLLRLREDACTIHWESFKRSTLTAEWYRELCETVSQIAETYRFYGVDWFCFPVLCTQLAQVHAKAGEKLEAKRWLEEARDLWANVVCSPGHHCVTDIQAKIDCL